METMFSGWAALEPGVALTRFQYQPSPLGLEDVQVRVSYCGLCYSDLSMIDNDWGASVYPLVPGHEIVGIVEAVGPLARDIAVGDTVGVGWFSGFCMSCKSCLSGRHNLCRRPQQTIVGRNGGFADRIRCHWSGVVVLPPGVEPRTAGPLFCGGLTVFSPLLACGVLPTHKVGVIGIGGLGHLAIKLLRKWGCHVTAFTRTASKSEVVKQMGAHSVVVINDATEFSRVEGGFHFILSTAPTRLDVPEVIKLLAPDGTLHFVGSVPEAISVTANALVGRRKRISGSPVGSPVEMRDLLSFCARHGIAPDVEEFSMRDINSAIDLLRRGGVRYRAVLCNDMT